MKRILFFSLVLIGACRRSDSPAPPAEEPFVPPPTGAPVETRAPHTSYQPAFTGQTRIGSVRTGTPWRSQVIFSGLSNPWGIASLPDGRLLITQKPGTIRIISTSGTAGATITGLPPVAAGGQGGLLDILPDRAFTQNRMLYWSYSEEFGNGRVTALAKGRLSDDEQRIENATVLFRTSPYPSQSHFGGRIREDAAGNLILTTGDRAWSLMHVQDLNSGNGKVIRVQKNGQPASGNPFIGQANALGEVYSYGHRNVQGLALHPQTGSVWISEMGPRGGDELNLILPGRNYGWPVISYGLEYNGQPVGAGITQQNGMEQPVYYWDPSIAPSGMTFHSGNNFPEWKNNLFIGTLAGQHIIRLVLHNDRVIGEERLLASEGQRFRSITEGNDGALYAITDGGRLYRIARQ